ncbi:MAG: NrpR regulatory domain-containing protein [Candidatus Abyssubacteria bacterium]
MSEKTEKKRLAILRVLQQSPKALGSSKITERLLAEGHEITERTVRFYLQTMDNEGLTENLGRRGRIITRRGLDELSSARIFEKVGYLAAKIDQMTYRMSFDLSKKQGTIVANVSLLETSQLKGATPLVKRVFEAGYAMGRLMALFPPGERVGDMTVTEGFVGIGTVCSITLNGVLLSHGIPTHSRFGGLLEVQDYKPTRFVQFIHYSGTTLDPLEIFIRSGMTDYVGATRNGNGRIGASFREVPAESRDRVIELAHRLEEVGLGGFMTIGWPGQPLLEIPVNHGQVGAIVIGGLNPVAILEEKGIKCHSRALAAMVPYELFFPYDELDDRIRAYL